MSICCSFDGNFDIQRNPSISIYKNEILKPKETGKYCFSMRGKTKSNFRGFGCFQPKVQVTEDLEERLPKQLDVKELSCLPAIPQTQYSM